MSCQLFLRLGICLNYACNSGELQPQYAYRVYAYKKKVDVHNIPKQLLADQNKTEILLSSQTRI